MVREFSQLVHLMEKGYLPHDFGSGWKISRPDPNSGEMELIDIDRFAIAQAKRFEFIRVIEDETGHHAVLSGAQPSESEPDFPIPSDDLRPLSNPKRLAALAGTQLMDSAPDACFDHITHLAAADVKCPISYLSLISEDRQFFKSIYGQLGDIADKRGSPLTHSLCKFVAASGSELIITDARKHPLSMDCPFVKELNIGSYAGFPVYGLDKEVLGAFCVIDQKPRKWSNHEIDLLREFADLATRCIEAHELRLEHDNRALGESA